jgi:hypothetical protein
MHKAGDARLIESTDNRRLGINRFAWFSEVEDSTFRVGGDRGVEGHRFRASIHREDFEKSGPLGRD